MRPHLLPRLFAALLAASSSCASNPPLPPKAIALNAAGAVALENGNLELAQARLALAL